MLFLGVVLAAAGAFMMTIATRQLSQVNEGHYLPLLFGRFAVASPVKVTALRVGAQAVIAVATWIVIDATWDYTAPWPSLVGSAVTLLAPVALPVIAITLAHNRRLQSASR